MPRPSALPASVHASTFYGHEAASDGLLALPLQATGYHSPSWVTAALASRVTWYASLLLLVAKVTQLLI